MPSGHKKADRRTGRCGSPTTVLPLAKPCAFLLRIGKAIFVLLGAAKCRQLDQPARDREIACLLVSLPRHCCASLAAPFLYRHNNDDLPDLSYQEYATLKEKTIEIIAAIPTRYLGADKGRAAIDALCAGRPVPVFVPFCFFPFFFVQCRRSHGGALTEDPDESRSTARSGTRPWPIEKTLSPDRSQTSLFIGCASSACRSRFLLFGKKTRFSGIRRRAVFFFCFL